MNVALPPDALRTLSLCSGGGGLDIGFALAVGNARTVCYVEREAFAAARLVEAMELGLLDDAPIWSDLAAFDCEPWRGVVDCVIGGWPCQPYSAAGKRRGAEDERDLWPEVLRIVAALRPRLLVGENVARFASDPDGLNRCVGDLERIGYRVTATLVTAADVGASHERERCFLLAVMEDAARDGRPRRDRETRRGRRGRVRETGEQLADTGRSGRRGHEESTIVDRRRPSSDDRGAGGALVHADEPGPQGRLLAGSDDEEGREESGKRLAAAAGGELADADRVGAERQPGDVSSASSEGEGERPERQWIRPPAGHGGDRVADADSRRLRGLGLKESGRVESECGGEPDGRRGDGWQLPHFPPGPSAVDEWRHALERDPSLAPALEPPFRELADGVAADRRHWLRLLGNGVVPLQAAYAVCALLAGREVSA